ncbi:MAG: NAD(P)/FAD-dependent oxidoreductase [Candidatus Spyradocola sp.]
MGDDILILGGGAAGLLAAIAAKRAAPRARVTVLEAGERVGKKILSTGNGRCNLTNLRADAGAYAPAPVEPVLQQFPPARALEAFSRMGLCFREEEDGRVYPASDAASSVLDALRLTGAHLGVVERTGFAAVRARHGRDGFVVEAEDGARASGARLLLATGGKAASRFVGYDIAEQLGHSVTRLSPGLVPLKTDGAGLKGLNGVRCRCAVTLRQGARSLLREEGEVLFKDYGLSGIAVFQLSRALARAAGPCEVEVDLLPGQTPAQAAEGLRARARLLAWRETDAFLLGMMHKNLAANLLRACGIGTMRVGEIPDEKLRRLAETMKGWRHRVTGTQGFQNAQVTVGGVPLSEVEGATLASRRCAGLFLAGEVLDVDGPCGGYNLQWAWASGAVAGKAAAQSLYGKEEGA